MQQREQRILKKLAEAREAQANAMSRFIQARARVMQVEARLQSIRPRLDITLTVPDQPPEPAPPLAAAANIPDISQPGAPPTAPVSIPPANTSHTPAQAADPLTASSPAVAAQTSMSTEQARASSAQPSVGAEQAVSNLGISTPTPNAATPAQADEEEEETTKMPSLRPARPVSPTQQQLEEGALNVALSALTQGEQSAQTVDNNKAQAAGATDITAKLPVIRREHGQTQEPI